MCQKSSHKSSLLFRVLNKIELVQLSRPAGHFNFSNYVHVTAALLLYFLNIIIEFPVKLRQRTQRFEGWEAIVVSSVLCITVQKFIQGGT